MAIDPREHRAAPDGSRAVIFDVDGVLVDSYRAHLESWQRLAAEVGRVLTEAEFAPLFGRAASEVVRRFVPAHETSKQRIDDLCARRQALYRDIARAEIAAVDGATDLIDALVGAGFRLAAASSAPQESVELAVERLGRADILSVRVAGEDARRPKPDPELYLIAARRLGIDPRRCAAIEDSPHGIAAARAAGMAVVGLVSVPYESDALASADHVVESLRALSPDDLDELILRHASSSTVSRPS